MYTNMTSLIHNLSKSSRKCLLSLYRMTYSTTSHQNMDIANNQNNITNDDHPIALKNNPFEKEKRKCFLCNLNIEPDYKNVRLLSQFQSSFTGRIYGRHITGLCKAKQKKLESEILKSQSCGFMPIYHKFPQYLRDPKLFDPDYPFRPHKY